MTFAEVARELQVSIDTIRRRVLRPDCELKIVNVGSGTERAHWRVTRTSFEAYCERLEREAAERFAS